MNRPKHIHSITLKLKLITIRTPLAIITILTALLTASCTNNKPPAPLEKLRNKPAVIVITDTNEVIHDVHVLTPADLEGSREIPFYNIKDRRFFAFGTQVEENIEGRRVSAYMTAVKFTVLNGQIVGLEGNTLHGETSLDESILKRVEDFLADPSQTPTNKNVYFDCVIPPPDLGQLVTPSAAMSIIREVAPNLTFTEQKISNYGLSNTSFRAGQKLDNSPFRLNVNVGESFSKSGSCGYMKVMIYAKDQTTTNLATQCDIYAQQYIGEISARTFKDGTRFFSELAKAMGYMPVSALSGTQWITVNTDDYEIQYMRERPAANRTDMAYRLDITHRDFQEALNKQYEKRQK